MKTNRKRLKSKLLEKQLTEGTSRLEFPVWFERIDPSVCAASETYTFIESSAITSVVTPGRELHQTAYKFQSIVRIHTPIRE